MNPKTMVCTFQLRAGECGKIRLKFRIARLSTYLHLSLPGPKVIIFFMLNSAEHEIFLLIIF